MHFFPTAYLYRLPASLLQVAAAATPTSTLGQFATEQTYDENIVVSVAAATTVFTLFSLTPISPCILSATPCSKMLPKFQHL